MQEVVAVGMECNMMRFTSYTEASVFLFLLKKKSAGQR